MHDIVDLDWSFVDTGRAQMREIGACEIPGFVRAGALPTLIEDARRLVPRAHRSGGPGTVYLGFPDESFPSDHPRQWLGNYGVGAVAFDMFPPESPIRQLYEWDELLRFVAAILALDVIYPYADPLGALNLAVMTEGDELQWHFDQTDFVVSLALQDSDQVFAGRHSLHRVSPIRGTSPRLVGLFGYDTKPGTTSSELLKEVRYGRVA